VVAVAALVWHALMQPAPASLGSGSVAAANSGIELHDTTVVGHGRGAGRNRKAWEITARRITISPDQRQTSFIGLEQATLFRDGRPHVLLKAGSASYDRFADTLQVQGGVDLRLADDPTGLTTPRLLWQGRSRTVRAPGPVTFITEGARLQAERATVDPTRSVVHVVNVTGRWRGTDLQADTCQYQARSNALKLAPLRLRSTTWSFAAMRARLDPRTGDFHAEKARMSTTVPTLGLAQRGERAGARLASAGLIVGLFAPTSPVSGADPAKPPAQPEKRSEIEFEADQWDLRNYEWGEVRSLNGNVVITRTDPKDPAKKLVLTANKVEYTARHDGKQVAVATGSPKVVDERSQVVAEKITLHVNERRAVAAGNVKIVTKPKKRTQPATPEPAQAPSASSEPSKETPRPRTLRERIEGDIVITAERAEYNSRTKSAVAEGQVVVTNRGRKITLPKVAYDDRTESLALTGPFTYVDEKGQTVHHSQDAHASVKEGEEMLQSVGDGRVKGRFFIKEDNEEERKESEKSTQPGAAPAENAKPAEPPSPGAKPQVP
jgi:lipopolysaccharide export system protein LptA